jgi:hypothetical protein
MERPVLDTIIDFVTSIGLEIIMRPITKDAFLPGLVPENGKIIVDTDKLLYPGDILHEAGHLAAYDAETRKTIGDPLPEFMSDGFEIMALAWPYTACLHIGLPPNVIFHAGGYKGEGNSLIKNFCKGHFIGVPILQYPGLAQ